MINTVLMDLDGTLLPFEQNEFVQAYFRLLCGKLCPLGFDKDAVTKAVWHGTEAMIRNDGSALNAERFWDAFAAVLSEKVRDAEAILDRFYTEEFHQARQVLRGDSPAAAIVTMLKEKGYTVVLATNPLFPAVAQDSRLSWLGLTSQDFALVTHYGNSRFCKPNPRYYEEVLAAVGREPSQCLMFGNSVEEDLIPASSLGMDVFFVNTFAENPNGRPTDAYRQGSLADLLEFVRQLPSLL